MPVPPQPSQTPLADIIETMAAGGLTVTTADHLSPHWQRQLKMLVPAQQSANHNPPPDGYTPIALQFRVDGLTAALASNGPVEAGDVALSARPVFQTRTGKWKSDYTLSWQGAGISANADFDPSQIRWLADLADLNAELKHSYYWYGDLRWQRLDAFADSGLWALLGQAAQLGVAFTGTEEVVLAGSADLQADLKMTQRNSLILTRLLVFDGQPSRPALMGVIGKTGLFAVEVTSAARRITFGPSQHRLSDDDLRLLDLSGVNVPASDIPAFMANYYPALRRRLHVTSLDGSVELPPLATPVLVAKIAAPSARRLDVTWRWRYGKVEHPFDDSQGNPARDGIAERAIVNTVIQSVRNLAAFANFTITPRQSFWRGGGLEAMAFAKSVLPKLGQLDDAAIELETELPQYTDITDAATINVSVGDTGQTDWFDLGVEIKVGQLSVPFQEIFTALSAGLTRLVLAGGQVMPIDSAEFAQLKSLIEEARALDDQGGHLRISRYQAGLWADLTELATNVEQLEAWRESVSALIDLVNTGQDAPASPLPNGLAVQLRGYQEHAYQWLTFLDTHRLGGILADDMGLGKTIEVLTWILGVVERDGPQTTPFLVVAPASVVGNWQSEASRFTPGLKVVVLEQRLKTTGLSVDTLISGADVVVMSYAIFRLDYEALSVVDWRGLILDEAQFVKNARSAGNRLALNLSALVKIAVTGTPLENDVMELWALLAIVAPGFCGTAQHFRDLYARPIAAAAQARARQRYLASQGRDYDRAGLRAADIEAIEIGEPRLAILRKRLRPLLLRRTKELVTPELPERIEQCVEVELAARHQVVYDTYLQRERARVLGLLGNWDKNRFAIFASLTVLRRLSLDASLIDPVKYALIPCAKLDTLMEQLVEVVAGGHKALVFSQFTSFLAKVVERLERAGIDYCYLDGHTRNRASVIKAFRDGQAPVFCLSLKAGGFGLTLTEADYVFLLDPWWNPATEQQAIDRTHRIGQTRNVMVVRLISANTIEDKVMALQARKREVFKAVLADDAAETSFAATLTADDIAALLLD